MSPSREDEARLMRLHIAAHDPALLRLLDHCRDACGARLTRLYCPLISVHYTDALGRRVHAYWRGARFERYARSARRRTVSGVVF